MSANRSTSDSADPQARRPRLRWGWIFLAGTGVSILTLLLVALVISVYAATLAALARGAPDVARIEWLATQTNWGAPVLAVLLTVGAASWVARRAGTSAVAHGTLVGTVSAISGLAIGLALGSGPVSGEAAALALTVVFTVGAGWLGGLEARRIIAGQETLYEVSRLIGAARNPKDIVAAIGERLAESEVSQVALWELVPGTESAEPDGIELRASWAPRTSHTWPPGLRLEAAEVPGLAQVHRGTPLLQLQTDQASDSERAAMQRLGVRSALLMPLMASEESPLMTLMVASHTPGGFTRGATRAYLTACAQAGLALENLRLVEQGRELGVLAERQRLSHEIHDTLTQGFTSIIMHLAVVRQTLKAKPEAAHQPADQQAERHLEQIGRTARESLSEARGLVWALRPETLENTSLPEALARITRRFSEESGIPATATVTGTPSSLSPEAEVTLLRAGQEALANVRKHAKAGRVAMTLSYMDDLVVLDVRDDGIGFDPSGSPVWSQDHDHSGLGLTGMHERLAELGGTLQVESSPRKGTTLVIELPAVGEGAARRGEAAKEIR